jgi:hypothetical protein
MTDNDVAEEKGDVYTTQEPTKQQEQRVAVAAAVK